VRPIDHEGEFFSVAGPGTTPRTPQGRPLIVQAGASEGGKDLGSKWADVIFTAQTTLEDGLAFADEMRARAIAHGRPADSLRILPGLSTVIGSTEEEAFARQERLDSFLGPESALGQIARRLGVKPGQLDPDAPVPLELFEQPIDDSVRSSHGFLEAQLNLARRENLTIRQLARRIRSGHRLTVGTPEQIADTIEEWFRAGAADGFNIMPDAFPSGARDFVEQVIPILQERGIFCREYTGTTLREHLGLAHPDEVTKAASPAA